MPLLKTVAGVVKPGGSDPLCGHGPKNHSNDGGGTLVGKFMGLITDIEHVSVYISPAILEPVEEIVTDPKFTVETSIQVTVQFDSCKAHQY